MRQLCLLIVIFLLMGSMVFLPHQIFADGTSCSDQTLSDAPNLFQVTRTKTSAQLYFSPVAPGDPITGYTISYGFQPGDERYAQSFSYGSSSGVVTYTINNLDPLEAYSFKVRADNGCANGPWSNYRSDNYHPPAQTKGGQMLVAGNWETSALTIAGFIGVLSIGALLFLL